MYRKIIEKLKDKKIAILGFGREGKSTYKFIRKYLNNQHLTIIDIKNVLEQNEYLKNDDNLSIIYGEKYLENLEIYDLIIKTPGISLKDIDFESIRDKITSQIELLLEVYNKNMIGITGTKGKSTTSSLIYKIIKDQGIDTYLVGNIGVPVLDEIENYNENTILVTEMSSHQLEFIKTSPHISIILNLYQDHLDHTGSLEKYHMSKMNIIKYQEESDYAIVDKDNSYLKDILNNNNYYSNILKVSNLEEADGYIKNGNIYLNNQFLIKENDLKRKLIGEHNLKNIVFCLMVASLMKLDFKKVYKSIEEFIPLEHRMEYVGTFKDIKFYNDSIATIPEATINACETLKDVNTLIFGGQDRGIDYTNLIEYIKKSNIENLIVMPTTGEKLAPLIKNEKNQIYHVQNLEDAVKYAYKVTKKGSSCILSPAAPSYEFFKNFEEKGKKYKECVIKEASNED